MTRPPVVVDLVDKVRCDGQQGTVTFQETPDFDPCECNLAQKCSPVIDKADSLQLGWIDRAIAYRRL